MLHFIKNWLIIFFLSLVVVALINIIVDPYSLWNSPRTEHINTLKPASVTRSRLVKPHQLSHIKANTLIMGNSRPEMGINPESACWPDNFRPIYNQAIPGVNLYQQFRLLQHASDFHKPGQLVVGIDFIDFLSRNPDKKVSWPPNKDIKNLSIAPDGKDNPGYPLSVLQDHLKVTFSLEALSDSIFTIFSQKDPFSSNLTIAGFNPAQDYHKIIATEGQAILFLQKNLSMIQRLNKPLYLLNNNNWSQSFETYRQLLDYSSEHKIKVFVFINPYHSDYLEIIRKTGLWTTFIQWKEKIANISMNYSNVTLWDFSLVNEFTTEQAPKNGVLNRSIKWFWEPAHYKANYGNIMLAQILETSCENTLNLATGIKVTHISEYMRQLKTQESLLDSSTSVPRIAKLLAK